MNAHHGHQSWSWSIPLWWDGSPCSAASRQSFDAQPYIGFFFAPVRMFA